MLKIYTKRAFEFRNPKTGQTVQTAFMGFTTVEDWVRSDPMFIMGTKTGAIAVIENPGQQKALENGGDPDTELTELRARGAELKISRASQMGKEKLKAAIAEAEAKLAGDAAPDTRSGDGDASLRQFTESNGIDISTVVEE